MTDQGKLSIAKIGMISKSMKAADSFCHLVPICIFDIDNVLILLSIERLARVRVGAIQGVES